MGRRDEDREFLCGPLRLRELCVKNCFVCGCRPVTLLPEFRAVDLHKGDPIETGIHHSFYRHVDLFHRNLWRGTDLDRHAKTVVH